MKTEKIVVAGGCFWCVEGVFSRTKGVLRAISGYANGDTPNPDYKAVCTGATGYAEGVMIEFCPDEITLESILDIFWAIHDPTTLNRQGADIGTQYRSGVFFVDEGQKETIFHSLGSAQKSFKDKIVTVVEPLKNWFEAEGYHQGYFSKNPYQGYCMAVVAPKIDKLISKFPELSK